MATPGDKVPVRVHILNQTLTLLTAGDPREVQDLAQSVDNLLSSIGSRTPNADNTRVAVLGCFHLADRLRVLESELNGLRERIGRKTVEFSEMLDAIVPEDEPR